MDYLLLMAMAACAAVSVWAVGYAGMKPHRSISLHVAEARRTQLVFGVILAAATVAFAVVLFAWLLPHYQTGLGSYVLFGLITGCLMTIALVPHVEGTWREPIHNMAAWGMVYVILVAMAMMLAWPLSAAAWYSGVALTIINLVLVILSLTRKGLRQWFLYLQVAYLAVFFSFLLVTVFV